MKSVFCEELETNANSPFKLSRPPHPHNKHLQAHQHHSHHTSITEKELYSRGIVRQVMQAQQHRTVKHDVHRIHNQTPLYATPKPAIKTGLEFSSIPPSDRLYSSVCSAKIRHISTAMGQRAPPSRTSSSKIATKHDPNISVSGLVTYKFSSVSAQRAVGLGQVDRLQLLEGELSALRVKRQCAQARQKSILSRSRREVRTQQAEQADKGIVSTERYLQQVLRNKQQNALIYNQRANKLRFIKQLMREDNLPYDDAHHIVQQIQEIHQSPQGRAEPVAVAAGVDEEEEMRHRRVSRRKNRVLVRFQTFVD